MKETFLKINIMVKGNLYYENGEYYKGQFKNGLRDGKGIQYYKNNKIKYEGDFSEDKYHGEGNLYYKNAEYYKGQFKNGIKHGKGTDYYKKDKKQKNSNIKYNGYYKNDKYDGNGILYYENGEYYKGEFKDNYFDGRGYECLSDGSLRYNGYFVKNIYEGKGIFFNYKEKEYYFGVWKNGKMNGMGKIFGMCVGFYSNTNEIKNISII